MCSKFDCEKLVTFAKYLLVILNVVSFVLGVALITVGSWIAADKTSLIKLIGNVTKIENKGEENSKEAEVSYYFTVGSVMIIGTGSFIALLSMIGFFGAIKHSKCLLVSYVSAVITITLVQIAGMILLAVFQRELENHVIKFLQKTLHYYEHEEHVTTAWDIKMERLNCCGVIGYEDFNTTLSDNLPKFCCPEHATNCTVDFLKNQTREELKPGCFTEVYNTIKGNVHYDVLIVSAAIVTNILGIASALLLINTVERVERVEVVEDF